MAGILDFLGGGSQGGVLSAASAPAATASPWASRLGLFGSTLQDVGANMSGNPQSAHHIADFGQLQRQRAVQQALAAA